MKFQVIVADPPWSFQDKLAMADTPRSASANYSIMSNKDILDMKIKDLTDSEGCILALWVPSSLLKLGMEVMESNGFVLKQTYVWVKNKKSPFDDVIKSVFSDLKKENYKINRKIIKNIKNNIINNSKEFINNTLGFFMGHFFRQSHEICLIGINNNKIYKKVKNHSQRSVSFAYNIKHSQKPSCLQDSLDIMLPSDQDGIKLNKLEMFARTYREGWIQIGNQSPDTVYANKNINIAIEELLLK